MIGRLALLRGDASPLGAAHAALGEGGWMKMSWNGSILLLPYSSHYLTGALYGRPLARLRESLRHLGVETVAVHSEPEDHAAILRNHGGLVDGSVAAPAGADRDFFERHLAPWMCRTLPLERLPNPA